MRETTGLFSEEGGVNFPPMLVRWHKKEAEEQQRQTTVKKRATVSFLNLLSADSHQGTKCLVPPPGVVGCNLLPPMNGDPC